MDIRVPKDDKGRVKKVEEKIEYAVNSSSPIRDSNDNAPKPETN